MKQDTRFRRAWREAGWPSWLVRISSVIVGGALGLYAAHLRRMKPDALANIAFGVVASLGGLLIVQLVVYARGSNPLT